MFQIPKIILASSSPRRAELLQQVEIEYEVQAADVDESILDNESGDKMVTRLSLAKANKIAELNPSRFVLAADTTVVIDGEILAKPLDKADAYNMLKKLSGKVHDVFTGISLVNVNFKIEVTELDLTVVEFYEMSDQDILQYVESGEPMDKAGSYGLQGRSAKFIKGINGNYTNVLGLNTAKVYKILTGLYDQGKITDNL